MSGTSDAVVSMENPPRRKQPWWYRVQEFMPHLFFNKFEINDRIFTLTQRRTKCSDQMILELLLRTGATPFHFGCVI